MAVAIRAWEMMDGLDWSALPTIVELLGVGDPEALIQQLIILRETKRPGA